MGVWRRRARGHSGGKQLYLKYLNEHTGGTRELCGSRGAVVGKALGGEE